MSSLKLIYCHFACTLLFLNLISCQEKGDDTSKLLLTIEKVIEQYPDRALSMLDSINSFYALSEVNRNKFLLLQIQAKDKVCRDITNDTAICIGIAYHQVGSFNMAIKYFKDAEKSQ